jgi:moderate conductance mechanosensitive channel
VIVCAFLAERIIRRAIRRPLAAVDHYVPRRARQPADLQPPPESEAASIADAHELRRWHLTLTYAWQLALRLPFVLARLVLELLPVLCFAAIGNLLLATNIGREATPRVVILAMVNAYVLYSTILYVTAAVVSPASSQPSLLVIRDETAAYFDVWWTRIVAVTVFGVALAKCRAAAWPLPARLSGRRQAFDARCSPVRCHHHPAMPPQHRRRYPCAGD